MGSTRVNIILLCVEVRLVFVVDFDVVVELDLRCVPLAADLAVDTQVVVVFVVLFERQPTGDFNVVALGAHVDLVAQPMDSQVIQRRKDFVAEVAILAPMTREPMVTRIVLIQLLIKEK